MGKSALKVKSTKNIGVNNYDDKVDEYYRPFLIHSTTFIILTEQVLALMPSERNVLLTMNEYNLSEINPTHPDTADSPTHVIIFCIRFIADDVFQPIGGLLIYKYEDQSAILAECLKAFIHDLWILGVHVVATVSPPFETFKAMLNHLVDIENINMYSGVITYSVAPFKEIVHIYDIQFLLIKLQNLLKEGDIKFVESTKEYRASWNDISLVLNLCSEFKILSNYLFDNKDVSRRVHIFTQQIFEQFLEVEAQGALSENAGGSAVLLNCVRTFLQFTELDLVNLSLMHDINCWDSLTHILQTMVFQKSKKRTCTKIEANTEIERLTENVNENLMIGKQNGCFEEKCAESVEEITDTEDKSVTGNNKKKEHKENKSNCIKMDERDPQNCKQKKRKKKRNALQNITKNSIVDQKLVQQSTPMVAENVRLDPENNTQKNVNNEKRPKECSTENGPCCKTDNLLDTVNTKNRTQNNFDENNKKSSSCDKNNNGDSTFQKNSVKQDGTAIQSNCDNKIKVKKDRKNKRNVEERFDFVIHDAQRFFQYFSGSNRDIPNVPFTANCNISSNDVHGSPSSDIKNGEIYFSDTQGTSEKSNDPTLLFNGQKTDSFDTFCSQSDEETENCITSSCDKVPNIIELLNNVTNNDASDDFEQNHVTFEMLCTVSGMKKVISNLTKRRVRIAKPDAFVVEHIDFLVTIIKRDRNNINPVYYYGHNYGLFNAELAFSTLHNKKGLYLVSK